MPTYPNKKTPDQRSFAAATVTTAADGLSDVIDCGGLTLAAIKMSTAWTDAPLMLLGSFDSSASMFPLFTTTGGRLTHQTSASRMLTFDPAPFAGLRFLQLASGDSSTAVAQAAARTVTLGLASYQPIK
jgi:hypothetical protein